MPPLFHRRVVFASHRGGSRFKKRPKRTSSSWEKPSMAGLEESLFSIPDYFTRPPPISDRLLTNTSSQQSETVAECLPHLNGTADPSRNPFDFNEHGLLRLNRQEHIDFLHQSLDELPAAFVGVDASRPWMVYWALMGLSLLGDDVTDYRDR